MKVCSSANVGVTSQSKVTTTNDVVGSRDVTSELSCNVIKATCRLVGESCITVDTLDGACKLAEDSLKVGCCDSSGCCIG